MKRDRIWVKQNIFDLAPRGSSFFLILRDNVENKNEKESLNIKKAKKLWEWDWKTWRKILISLFDFFEKGNGKIEFLASRLSTKYLDLVIVPVSAFYFI